MFNNIHCTMPQEAERQTSRITNQFIKAVLEEDRRVKKLHAQEIQSTAENPRIKAQNETIEISAELKQHKRAQFLEEKRRQQLRQNNIELRQLEVQLRAAYVSKALDEQKAERDRLKEQQVQEQRQENANLEKKRLECVELSRLHDEQERLKKDKFRKVLLDQMAQINAKRLQEYEELIKDKEAMHQTVRKMELEDIKEMQDLIKRKERARDEIHDFMQTQETLKLQQRAQKMDETKQLFEELEQREAAIKRREAEKRQVRERKRELSEKIGKQLFAHENEKRKRENLLLDLLVEERKAKEDLRFRQNLEKQNQERIAVHAELEHYHNDILRIKKEQHLEKQALLREEQMRIFAEQDKLDQLSNEKRRRKVQEHRRTVQAMIEDKRRQRAAQSAELVQQHEMMLNEDRRRQENIEDERIRLLKSQPLALLKYLPVGVLRESDREFLALPTSKTNN